MEYEVAKMPPKGERVVKAEVSSVERAEPCIVEPEMEEVMERIRGWDYHDPGGLLRYIAGRWRWDDWWAEREGLWVFATGGWSEHEMMLGALQENLVWHVDLGWYSLYLPGGLLIVAVSEGARGKLRGMIDKIRNWAWREVGLREDGNGDQI